MTLTQKLQIHCNYDGRAFSVFRALKQPRHEIIVFERVDLKPEGFAGMFRHIFDRADRHSREGERHAKFFCGTRRFDLAISALHTRQPNRGQGHGHRHIMANHGRGCAAV